MADVNFQYGIFRFESDAEREFNELRTIKTEDGEILFCATDAAKMIGYANTRDAINRHCKHVVKHDIPPADSRSSARGRRFTDPLGIRRFTVYLCR